MAGLQEMAKAAGAHSIRCPHCGGHFKMMRILEMLFVAIVSAVRDGQKVSIKNFGTFSLRHLPGRKMANPFNEGVELSYGDRKVMAFRQAVATKRFMNRKDHSQEKRRPLARKGASDE